jgi:capsular polysaccharide transport system permease protein
MTSSPVAKTSDRFGPGARKTARPEEERIGQRYEARRRRRARALRWGLAAVVTAPTALAALYYGLWAAPRYESETQFIVRGVQGSRGATGLEGVLRAFGISRSGDDSNAVLEYLVSRDAVAGLEAALPLRKMYAQDGADAPARFPRPFMSASFERLYWYYNDRVRVISEPDTGIIAIQAQAFRPDDARAIARQLLSQAESLVNAMNVRLETDTVRSAEAAVAEANKVVLAAQQDVSRFRDAEIVVDPSQNAAAQLSAITDLSTQVDQVLAQISESNKLSPSSPTVAALKAKADALSEQISAEQKALAGSHEAVADKVSNYERLTLLRGLVDASLAAARAALEAARSDVRRQHVFIEEIVAPNLPDESTQPQRLRAVATVFVVSLAALSALWLFWIAFREQGH